MAREKKTHKQFMDEMYLINPNIEILGRYERRKNKIKIRCKADNYEWEMTADNLLKGKGCPKCNGNIKKTQIEFETEVKCAHDNIEIIGKYINNHTKIKCRCKTHNYIFEINPSSLLNGYGCQYCSGNLRTHDQFVNEIRNINKNVTILGIYNNTKTKILVKCNIDGYEWKTTPYILLQGHGCPRCSGKLKRTHQEFIEDLELTNKDITVIGKFINLQKHIKVKCNVCNNEWNPVANSLLQGNKCPHCSLTNSRKTHKQFVNDLYKINKNILVIDKYLNSITKIKVQCLIDNNEWYAKPANLLSGYGCPVCNASKGEKRIQDYLDKYNINYIPQIKYKNLLGLGNGLLSYDFYLIDFNLLIEYQGVQHEKFIKGIHIIKENFEKQIEHDRRKKKYAIDNNIKLLEIWYCDFDNIDNILDFNLTI